ncbi:MAG: hypothetical protein L0Z51_02970 [Candidatus Latescibacteria bacterium]|nr:hypothetical protein [Candidatus Latescibacterota bacterium]
MDEQIRFAVLITSRLQSARIPFMITGSMALAVYAIPRMTRDIDLVVECQPDDAVRIAGLFQADCYVDVTEIQEAVLHRSMFNIIHNEWIVKADFIVRKDDEYRRLEFSRRRDLDIAGTTMPVVSVEDLILSKLSWAKASESEPQFRDARTLVATVSKLDWPYLQKWAGVLGVSQLLDEVRR